MGTAIISTVTVMVQVVPISVVDDGVMDRLGMDTQRVLGTGTAEQVRKEVKRRATDLMPGGGSVFNPVHNIQGNVPPENIVAK